MSIDNSKSLKRKLRTIQTLCNAGNYAKAVDEGNALIKTYPYFTPLLVLKAQTIQLLEGDTTSASTLEEAKEALMLAVDLDPKAVDALNELAFYLSAVEDDDAAALGLFERSIDLSKETLKEAFIGRIKCLLALEQRSEALACFKEALRFFRDHPGIKNLKGDFSTKT